MHASYPILAICVGLVLSLGGVWLAVALTRLCGFPSPRAVGRIGYVDGLRGCLATSVLVHHGIIWLQMTRLGGTWSAPSIAFFNNLGAGAVALFFMVSGLVFYPRILAGFDLAGFIRLIVNRIVRILPLTIVSVGVVAIIALCRSPSAPPASEWIKPLVVWVSGWGEPPLAGLHASYQINGGVLWSIYYEWLFYLLILPACALYCSAMRAAPATWMLPVGLLIGSLTLRALHIMPFSLVFYLPLFALGMLAHEARSWPAAARVLRDRRVGMIGLLCLLIAMVAWPDPYGVPQFVLYSVFFATVVCGNPVLSGLGSTVALIVGECSFGIYLFNGIALSLIFTEGSPMLAFLPTAAIPLLFPIAATLTVLVAAAGHILVEKPGIDLGRRMGGLMRRRLLPAFGN